MHPWLAAPVLLTALAAGCGPGPAKPPAAVEKPKVEADLGRTTLSAPAARSLKIHSEPLHSQHVQEQTQLTGWVMACQGHEVTITAPVAGYVREPSKAADAPVAGLPVQKDQELFLIEPVLSPLEQIQLSALLRGVENELAKARESETAAEKEWLRVKDLYAQKLRGEQDLEQAKARLGHAREDRLAAEDKRKLFADSARGEGAALRPVVIRAPRAGTVLAVPVSPGQYVPATAPLVTVADLSKLWVRVPVPESDLPQVRRGYPATAHLKPNGRSRREEISFTLQPVAVVPLVDTARHTADLIYELPAEAVRQGIFAKDLMIAVAVPLGEPRPEKDLVVPYAAVVFDAYAGAWVYFDLTADGAKEHVYERRRVELGTRIPLAAGAYRDARDGVVIRLEDKPAGRVVTAGAAALFSREFHKPPVAGSSGPVDDDD
jgi:cobalt-zinc-cadmium efflux system membrane fusion protein